MLLSRCYVPLSTVFALVHRVIIATHGSPCNRTNGILCMGTPHTTEPNGIPTNTHGFLFDTHVYTITHWAGRKTGQSNGFSLAHGFQLVTTLYGDISGLHRRSRPESTEVSKIRRKVATNVQLAKHSLKVRFETWNLVTVASVSMTGVRHHTSPHER